MTFRMSRRAYSNAHAIGLLVLGALLSPLTVLTAQPATGTVRGRVTEAGSGRGIADAQVLIVDTRLGASTGADGRFTIVAVPAGPRSITVRRLGYQDAKTQTTEKTIE